MAANTNPQLQTQIIYSIYVRNHTPEGTFRAVIPDLDRIRALGTDIIWFLPIHPIGVEGKKGTLGCPYANRDYRSVNPAYGTMDDFKALVQEIHARGMKCMIDVVYNHTSPDSTLYHEHPDFFYRGADGKPGNKMGDWSDVIDLDYHNPDLWAYQIESLKFWAGIVDGFRCDVASFVPLEFWKAARKAVSEVNPDCIWLAETVHQSFGCLARYKGVRSELDYDMYEAFDTEYEYDIREAFDKYLQGKIVLSHYLDMLNFQEAIYPANYNKLRFLENHDQPRICSYVKSEQSLRNYTAMLYFLKGTTLLYAGQENQNETRPDLFNKDVINLDGSRDISDMLRQLYQIKKLPVVAKSSYRLSADEGLGAAIGEHKEIQGKGRLLGIFSFEGKCGQVEAGIQDGTYTNMVNGKEIRIEDGKIDLKMCPVIIKENGE